MDDADIMVILAEGETNLMQALDCMVAADIYDDALIQGLKVAKDTMAARLHRFEERKKSRRVIIEQAMMLLQCNSLQRPTATLSLTERPPSLVVEEEAQVPAQFFDMKPILNRRRAKEALEAGEAVAGARLSSGSITVTVRRR
ncbi:MAG: siphovirus Gp157 family protein [Terricaulis sp.]